MNKELKVLNHLLSYLENKGELTLALINIEKTSGVSLSWILNWYIAQNEKPKVKRKK